MTVDADLGRAARAGAEDRRAADRQATATKRRNVRVMSGTALVAVALAVIAWGAFIGTTSTAEVGLSGVPACHVRGWWAIVANGHSYVSEPALQSGISDATAMPPGNRLRITHRWFQSDTYIYVANDKSTWPLHELPKYANGPPCLAS